MTDYIPAVALARKLGVKPSTLARWRRAKTGPQGWIRLSATHVVYPVETAEAWIEEKKKAAPKPFGNEAA